MGITKKKMKKFNFNIDQKVSIWHRTSIDIEANSLKEAKEKLDVAPYLVETILNTAIALEFVESTALAKATVFPLVSTRIAELLFFSREEMSVVIPAPYCRVPPAKLILPVVPSALVCPMEIVPTFRVVVPL